MAKGKVARFFDQKGFGFIEPEGGGKDLFVHINEVEGGQLQEGDSVEYEETEGRKGLQASGVKVLCGRIWLHVFQLNLIGNKDSDFSFKWQKAARKLRLLAL